MILIFDIYSLGNNYLPQINNVRGLKNFKPPILYDRKNYILYIYILL